MASDYSSKLFWDLPEQLADTSVLPNDPLALRFVADAVIGDGWLMPNASNYTFLVELGLGNLNGYGIYKPQKGETPLWDFPEGSLYQRERAAYLVSELLDWNIVPPTVEREGILGVGSLQLFVPHNADSNYFTIDGDVVSTMWKVAVFDVVVNNADRKASHCFQGQDGNIWCIDHGLTFHNDHKLRTVVWDFAGEEIPDSLLRDLNKLIQTVGNWELSKDDQLGLPISEEEVRALSARVKMLLSRPIMPHPLSRRDLPWPWL